MESGTRRRSLAFGVVAAAIALASAACSSSGSGGASGSSAGGSFSGNQVVIGQELCQTGYLSVSDLYLVKGAQLAVDQLNKAGGILHHQVKLMSADTQCVASNEIQLAESFIVKSHVNAIIGGFQSAAISGVLPIVKQAKVPFMAAGTLPTESPWGMTTFPSNTYPGQTFLSYVASKLHAKTVGNITGDTPYGAALQAAVTSQAKGLGLTTTNVEVSNAATTTTPVLQKVAGADVIFSNTSGPINIIMAKDAANLGLKVPLVFNDPADCPQIAAAYQPVLCIIPQAQLYPAVANAGVKANDGTLWDAYKATGGKMLNFGSVTAGADQVQMIAKAITKAGSTDGEKVNEALSTLEYTGAQGEYKYTPGHTFGVANPYILASTSQDGKNTVVYQPSTGAAS
jgi:branched-chain amino acid transport system substrate-binding protein